MFLTLRVVTKQPYNLHDLHQSVCNVRNIDNLQLSDSVIQFLYVTNYRSVELGVLPGNVYCHVSSQYTLWWEYRYETHNDVSVNDGPHIGRWSHNIIIQYNSIVLQLPTVFSTVTGCTGV
jgi:hypothetical protein